MNPYWGCRQELKKTDQKENGNAHAKEGDPAVTAVGNRIYYYTRIDTAPILELNKALVEVSGKLISEFGNDAPPIKLHINSRGGYLYDCMAGIDGVLRCPVPVHTVVEGAVASAATLLSVHGAKRYMTRNSFMLIHQLSGIFWGKYEDMKDSMENADALMRRIKAVYTKYTKVPEAELEKILKHDLWWDSNTCLGYGMVDEVI